MAENGLGLLLKALREQRQLSPREVARLAEMDHAYVYRLETGEKDSPSQETVEKLIRGLKPERRELEMLKYLASHPDVDPALVRHVLDDKSVTAEIFAAVAGSVYRGTGRVDYTTRIERMKRILDDDAD